MPAILPEHQLPARKRRILIAEDNEDAALTLQMLLDALGYEAHVTSNGEAAVRASITLRPEIAILDIGMPRLSGYDAAHLIREASTGRDMLIIALTGWGRNEDIEQSAAAGFDHHLVKPLDLVKLKAILDSPPGYRTRRKPTEAKTRR